MRREEIVESGRSVEGERDGFEACLHGKFKNVAF